MSVRRDSLAYNPIRDNGAETAQWSAEAFLGDRPGAVLLERGVPLRGRVTDADGDGIDGTHVTAMAAEATESRPQNTVTTGPDGAFTVPGLPRAGRLDVSVWRDGYQYKSLPNLIRDPDRPLVIVLEPSFTLSGQVVGPSRASVTLERTSHMGKNSRGGGTDGEGRFSFPGQAPGKVTVTVTVRSCPSSKQIRLRNQQVRARGPRPLARLVAADRS